MSLDAIRDRVVLVGGKVAGVSCPRCDFRSLDVKPDRNTRASVTCPDCGATILTETEIEELREADKF